MSYHIYTTKGIVLSSQAVREADRLYTILTRDLGLVRASAGGVRKESSKLRASLEPYSISLISLVKGKGDWRITSAALLESLPNEFKDNKEMMKSVAKVYGLMEKLIGSESAHPELYDKLEYVADYREERDVEAVEIFLVAQALYELGYLTQEVLPKDLNAVKDNKKELVKAINSGLSETGLT